MTFVNILGLLFFAINLISSRDICAFLKLGSPMVFILFAVFYLTAFNKIFVKSLFCFLWILTSLLAFYKLFYGVYFNVEIALSFFDVRSQPHLILELLELKLILWFVFVSICPCILVILWKAKMPTLKQRILGFLFSCLVVIIFFVSTRDSLRRDEGQSISIGKSSISILHFAPFDAIYSLEKAYRFVKKKPKVMSLVQEYGFQAEDLPQDLKIIFIIGETARSDRFQINGYARETSPNLANLQKSDGGFFSFKNTRACRTYTKASVLCMFSRYTEKTFQQNPTETAFTEVFANLGFKISVISLQTLGEFYKYIGAEKVLVKQDVLLKTKSALDGQLTPLAQEIMQNEGRQFIVLHSIGSHYHYHQRYPSDSEKSDSAKFDFEKFTPTCKDKFKTCNTEMLNNTYDNSILYTDHFINEVIKLAKEEKAVVFYISDHGESLGENGNFFHSFAMENAPKEQLEVPFFVYISPEFAKHKVGKKMKEKLEKHRKEGLSHDNIFHSTLGCLGISNQSQDKKLIDESLNICR